MLTTIEAYHRPTDLETAWTLLQQPGAVPVAGGTDLVARRSDVTALVDLAGLGLDGIDVDDGALRIGAMATFTAMLEHPDMARFGTGVLAEMLVHVGSVLHRNSATIGGHLARGRLSDVIPVLLALDAEVDLYDGAKHRQSLTSYYASGRHDAPHLVLAVRLPAPEPRSAAAFVRFSRSAFDVAQLNCAGRIDLSAAGADGVATAAVSAARVVVGELGILGRRLPAAEEALTGRMLDDDTIEAAVDAARSVLADVPSYGIGIDYRSHLAGVAVRRTLTAVAARLADGTAGGAS